MYGTNGHIIKCFSSLIS